MTEASMDMPAASLPHFSCSGLLQLGFEWRWMASGQRWAKQPAVFHYLSLIWPRFLSPTEILYVYLGVLNKESNKKGFVWFFPSVKQHDLRFGNQIAMVRWSASLGKTCGGRMAGWCRMAMPSLVICEGVFFRMWDAWRSQGLQTSFFLMQQNIIKYLYVQWSKVAMKRCSCEMPLVLQNL